VHELDLVPAAACGQLHARERGNGRDVRFAPGHVAQDDAAPSRRLGCHRHKDRRRAQNSSHADAAAGVLPGMRLYDYPGSCNCYKVRLLLAQLGMAYERVPVDIFAGETLAPEFGRINPARTTPVLETDAGRMLPESAAILTYLATGTPLLPAAAIDRAEVVRWLVYEQTDVIPAVAGLRFRLLTGRLAPADPDAVRRVALAADVLRLLDDHLEGREFVASPGYSIADIALHGYLHRSHEAGIDLAPYGSVRAWLGRVEAQPGYMEDVAPYGANAARGAGRSIYDSDD
jgi:glutathione S-transferase